MEYFDVSDWLETSAPSTKGTRDKLILAKPETNDVYFLKFPMIRENRDYTPEIWSEIIAYEVGTALGFNVLRYDFAVRNGRIGCISKNMITPGNNESLVEGHQILSRYDSSYNPDDKDSYHQYTFHFVQKALDAYGASFFMEDFIRTLIFDAIIGNSDRHQSNWGLIQSLNIIEEKSRKPKFSFRQSKTQEESTYKFVLKRIAAPIYDSGCCLGREFGESQILQHLEIQSKFDKYIRNGVAELRIDESGKKPSHEELLRFIKTTDNGRWTSFVDNEIQRVIQAYNADDIHALILSIDNALPPEMSEKSGLSSARKTFIYRVLDTRISNLKNI